MIELKNAQFHETLPTRELMERPILKNNLPRRTEKPSIFHSTPLTAGHFSCRACIFFRRDYSSSASIRGCSKMKDDRAVNQRRLAFGRWIRGAAAKFAKLQRSERSFIFSSAWWRKKKNHFWNNFNLKVLCKCGVMNLLSEFCRRRDNERCAFRIYVGSLFRDLWRHRMHQD